MKLSEILTLVTDFDTIIPGKKYILINLAGINKFLIRDNLVGIGRQRRLLVTLESNYHNIEYIYCKLILLDPKIDIYFNWKDIEITDIHPIVVQDEIIKKLPFRFNLISDILIDIFMTHNSLVRNINESMYESIPITMSDGYKTEFEHDFAPIYEVCEIKDEYLLSISRDITDTRYITAKMEFPKNYLHFIAFYLVYIVKNVNLCNVEIPLIREEIKLMPMIFADYYKLIDLEVWLKTLKENISNQFSQF